MCRLNLSFAHKRANSICWFWICPKFLTPAATDSEVSFNIQISPENSLGRLIKQVFGVLRGSDASCWTCTWWIKDPKSQICAILNSSAPSFFLSFFPLRLSENQVDKKYEHLNTYKTGIIPNHKTHRSANCQLQMREEKNHQEKRNPKPDQIQVHKLIILPLLFARHSTRQ